MLGHPVSGKKHVRLNRDLFREFAAFLAAAKWDIALLQEVPPRWGHRLADATGAEAKSSAHLAQLAAAGDVTAGQASARISAAAGKAAAT